MNLRVRHHGRFYLALLAALVALVASRGIGSSALRILITGNAFFTVYLASTAVFLVKATTEHLRSSAAAADEGIPLILIASGVAAAVSLGAVFVLLGQAGIADSRSGLLAVAGVPLGWLTLHTLAAFHYANLYYAPKPGRGEKGGLEFPGTPEPGPWDFLYFAFVIGMTAQVSDVAIRSARIRRTVLAHGVVSFFYYTVIVAVTVNAALAYAQ